ncbi:c-type cytochrome [Gillisia sp. CAL575]|uniref:c-type cytochrome n=1 Tax=Gillisia sp. CAL575 TaxID=985255 RepID=UPI0003A1669F|nr:cytochrome c [Gillisia sp. CAL575]
MRNLIKIIFLFGISLLISCGDKEDKKENDEVQLGNYEKKDEVKQVEKMPEADLIDMSNKGIGPVKNLELPNEIDQGMVAKGKAGFDSKCLACHKTHKKFIGPAPVGILDRRSPEWIMNMILNPGEMVQDDPIAKQLLIEHNGSPMANQGLTEEEARQILEYFRTLK